MNEDIFNLKAAGKKKPNLAKRPTKAFRLEEKVALSASDKYNDPYFCEISARKLRNRYVISVLILHGPIQSAVYNQSWLFNDMATCWDKFHAINDTVTDIRNFVEAEGLKNISFQFMVKHALSNISADVENMYETNIPIVKQVIDESTRGNIIQNFPTMPFRTQSGPDQLDDVYTSVGNAGNPIPEDGIKGQSQYAIPQHKRKEMGLKDVLPSPISPFQQASGITSSMFTGAASEGTIKTGAASEGTIKTAAADEKDKAKDFIQKVKDNAHQAVEHGKKAAISHYVSMTGADEAEAEAFYLAVKAVASQSKIVLNLSATSLLVFMASNEYRPLFENPDLMSRFNHYASKREQAERAIGCFGLSPTYASVTFLQEGDRGYGKCAMKLEDIDEDTILICGDSFRVRNPSRSDYVADANLILYPYAAIQDCKAASIITSMSQHDLAAGPARALESLLDPTKDFGRCEALIFKNITPANVAEIVAASADASKTIRKILMRMEKMIPVVTCRNDGEIISPATDNEADDDPVIKQSRQKHFAIGDRVATKPTIQHPRVTGTIIDVANGQITVQWDNKEDRSMFDMVEALMRLMSAPEKAPVEKGMVVYQLPGMDEQTVMVLSASGVDPVSLYSMASHFKPAAKNAKGALERMIDSMAALGLHATMIKGFVPSEDGDHAFTHREWIQAKLPSGERLIVDFDADKLIIKAGDTDDYIEPMYQPPLEIE